MPTVPPPPRYRVIERGRRLEVIDTATGEPVQAPTPGTPATRPGTARWPTWPEQQGFDGRALLTTHHWYDGKAPRRLLLDPGTVQWIGAAKAAALILAMGLVLLAVAAPAALVVLVLPLALLSSRRDALRQVATGWLDRFSEPPGV